MYQRKSRLTPRTQGKFIGYFVGEMTDRAVAGLVGVQHNTAIRFFMHLRQLIASRQGMYELSGDVEADESYFGGVRKGKRGRGAAGKVIVFGLLQRHGKVYTVIVPNAKIVTLLPIIREKVQPDSIVYTDQLRSYNALDVSEFRHVRINHSNTGGSAESYQWDRKLLGASEATLTSVQWDKAGAFLLVSERV